MRSAANLPVLAALLPLAAAAGVQTASLNTIDLDSNPQIVTNVTFDGEAFQSAVNVAITNAPSGISEKDGAALAEWGTYGTVGAALAALAACLAALKRKKADKDELADVATSGSYNDLSDRPSLPDDLDEALEAARNAAARIDEYPSAAAVQTAVDMTPVYGTTAEWEAKPDYVPDVGVIVVWTDAVTVTDAESGETSRVPGLKVGDGATRNVDLPFANGGSGATVDAATQEIIENIVEETVRGVVKMHTDDNELHVTEEDRTAWDSSVTIPDKVVGETLAFTSVKEKEVQNG